MQDATQQTSEPDFAISPQPHQRHIVSRLAALLLVAALAIAMEWGSAFAVSHLPLTINETLMAVLGQLGFPAGVEGLTDVDFTPLALAMLGHNLAQYGALLLVAMAAALLAGNASRRQFGLTLGRRSLKDNVLIGLAGGVITGFLASVVFVSREVFDLGGDTPFWWAMERTHWDADFWLLTFVGSFGLVALFEELAFRGGMLGRLAQSFAPGAALLGIAVFFAYTHSQYFALGLIGYITLATVLLSAIVFGYVFLRTGSLIPAVIAHAIINIPMSFELNLMKGALCLVLMVVIWRPVWHAIQRIVREILTADTLILLALAALIGAVVWLASHQLGIAESHIQYLLVGGALLLAGLSRFTGRRDTLASSEPSADKAG